MAVDVSYACMIWNRGRARTQHKYNSVLGVVEMEVGGREKESETEAETDLDITMCVLDPSQHGP